MYLELDQILYKKKTEIHAAETAARGYNNNLSEEYKSLSLLCFALAVRRNKKNLLYFNP